MYRALSADIHHLEKYATKAKSQKMDVHRRLENLGISGDILEGDEEVHYSIINIPSKPTPENESEIIEIEPNVNFISPEQKRKDEAVTIGESTLKTNVVPKRKKSNLLSATSKDVIILGSSSDDETGLDLGSNFDLQKVKLKLVDSFEMKNVDEVKTKKKGAKDDKTKHKDDKTKHKDDKTKHKDDKTKHTKDKTPNIQELKYSMNKEGKYL